MKKRSKIILGIVLAVLAVGCLGAGIYLLNSSLHGGNVKNKETEGSVEETAEDSQILVEDEENVTNEIESDAEAGTAEETGEELETEAENPDTPVLVDNPYVDYFLQNEDMAAWLYIPDTLIDYPVMYTPGDEEYYLRRGFDKNYSTAGCLILDTDSCMEPLSTNLIIHGHNMSSGTMFGMLNKYEDEEYAKEHHLIYLYGKDYEHIYEVMAVFKSKVFYKSEEVFKYYKFFNAFTQEEFSDFYDNVKELSEFDTGVTAEFGDNFITLSTCSYHVENGRLVVVAKEIEPGQLYLPFTE